MCSQISRGAVAPVLLSGSPTVPWQFVPSHDPCCPSGLAGANRPSAKHAPLASSQNDRLALRVHRNDGHIFDPGDCLEKPIGSDRSGCTP